MLNLGNYQELEVSRRSDYGYYLMDEEENEVLLPNRFVTDNMDVGMKIEVFIFRDSEDRLTATTKKPYITRDRIGFLNVKQITPIGAFLDWGLDKDLFLPFQEQRTEAELGKRYLVGIYLDKSDRLCATMKVYNILKSNSPYVRDDMVKGIIYQESPDLGVLVAVDGKYHGLIQKKDVIGALNIGDEIDARVTEVRFDGKLNLSLTKKACEAMDEDAQIILEKLKLSDGFLPFNDKSQSEDIKLEFKMSKNAFKRAVGRLFKQRRIVFEDEGIKLVK